RSGSDRRIRPSALLSVSWRQFRTPTSWARHAAEALVNSVPGGGARGPARWRLPRFLSHSLAALPRRYSARYSTSHPRGRPQIPAHRPRGLRILGPAIHGMTHEPAISVVLATPDTYDS